ncbi:9620_t:CDS:2, partial [Funneliformis geosporum]
NKENTEYNPQQGYNYSHQQEISDNNYQVFEAAAGGQHETQNEYYQQQQQRPPYSQYQQGGNSHSQQQLTYQQVNSHQNQASIPHGYQGSPHQNNISDPQYNHDQRSPHQYASSSPQQQQQMNSSRTASVPQTQEHTTYSPEPNVYSIGPLNGNVNNPDGGMNNSQIIGQREDQSGPINSSQGVPIIVDQDVKGVQGSDGNLQQQGGNNEFTRQIYYSSEPTTAYITKAAIKSDGMEYEQYPQDAYTAEKLETSDGGVGDTYNRYDSYNNDMPLTSKNEKNNKGDTPIAQYNNNNYAFASSSQFIVEPINVNKNSFPPSIISNRGTPNPNPIIHFKDQSSRATSITSSNSRQKNDLQSPSLPLTVTANQHLPPPEVPSGSHPKQSVTSLSNPQSYYNIPPSPLISPLPTQVANTQESVQGTNSKVTNSQIDSQIPSQVVNISAQMNPQKVNQIESQMNSSQISSSDYYTQPIPSHASRGYSQSTPSQYSHDYSKEESGAHEIVFPRDDVVAQHEIVTSSQQRQHNGRVASVAGSDGGFYNSRVSLNGNLDKTLPPPPPPSSIVSTRYQSQHGSEASNYGVEARPHGRESRNHGSETNYGSEKNYGSEINYGNYGVEFRQHGREMNDYEANRLPGGGQTNENPTLIRSFSQIKSLEQIWGMPTFVEDQDIFD